MNESPAKQNDPPAAGAHGIARALDLDGLAPRLLAMVRSVADLSLADAPSLRPALTALTALTASDIAFLQYTSGSTGDPKGVILIHANLLANLRAMWSASKVSSSDFVSWLPRRSAIEVTLGEAIRPAGPAGLTRWHCAIRRARRWPPTWPRRRKRFEARSPAFSATVPLTP